MRAADVGVFAVALAVALVLLAAPARAHGPGDPCPGECGLCAQPSCGDNKCDVPFGETCRTCTKDCGECTARCGDGKCDINAEEWCFTCPDDCGFCPEIRICNGTCEPQIGEACVFTAPPDAGPSDAPAPKIVEQSCGNQADDDGDGKTDCADSDCADSPLCTDAGTREGISKQPDPDGCRVAGSHELPKLRGVWGALLLLLLCGFLSRRRRRA